MYTDVNQKEQAIAGRLNQLPAELPPPYDWQEFKRRYRARVPAPRDAMSWRHAAVAAGVVILVVAVAVWSRMSASVPQTAKTHVSIGDPRALGRPAGDGSLDNASRIRAAGANAQSDGSPLYSATRAARTRAIEDWLAALPQDPAVVRVGTRAAAAGLEDRIAQVDDLLNSIRLDGAGPDHLAALQQERANLMGSLAQVRYAEVVDARSP